MGPWRRSWLGFPVMLWAALGAAAPGSPTVDSPFDPVQAEKAIREIEEAWAKVAVTGDPAVIERIFADDFVGVSPEGATYSKRKLIEDTKAHPLGFASNQLNEMKVRFVGHVAVAQGNETFTRKDGVRGRFVWTDVLELRSGRWQLIAAQDVIAPADAARGSTGAGPTDPERRAIDKTRVAYVAAWRAGDAARITELYTPDARVLYPNQPPLLGRKAILAYFKDLFDEFTTSEFELTPSEVVIYGPWAFDQGQYRWRGTPRAGGTPNEDDGKYLVILQREQSGEWRVARDMDNSDRPATRGAKRNAAPAPGPWAATQFAVARHDRVSPEFRRSLGSWSSDRFTKWMTENGQLTVVAGDLVDPMSLPPSHVLHVHGNLATTLQVGNQAEVVIGGSILEDGHIDATGIAAIHVQGDVAGVMACSGMTAIWIGGSLSGQLFTGQPSMRLRVGKDLTGKVAPSGQPSLLSIDVGGYAAKSTLAAIAKYRYTRLAMVVAESETSMGFHPLPTSSGETPLNGFLAVTGRAAEK